MSSRIKKIADSDFFTELVRSGWRIIVIGWFKKPNGRYDYKEFEFQVIVLVRKLEALTTYQRLTITALLGVVDETTQDRWRSQSLFNESLAGSVTPMEQMKANLGRLGSFTERAEVTLNTYKYLLSIHIDTYMYKLCNILYIFFTMNFENFTKTIKNFTKSA